MKLDLRERDVILGASCRCGTTCILGSDPDAAGLRGVTRRDW